MIFSESHDTAVMKRVLFQLMLELEFELMGCVYIEQTRGQMRNQMVKTVPVPHCLQLSCRFSPRHAYLLDL